MKTQTARINTTKYTATVSEAEISAAMCELLAKQHGLSLACSDVRYRGWHTAKTVNAGVEHAWGIEVTVDHSADAMPARDQEDLARRE